MYKHCTYHCISVDSNKYIKNSLIKLTFRISNIATHTLRYKMHVYRDTICPLSNVSVGNYISFLYCSALNEVRQMFIPDKFYSQPSSFWVALLLSCKNNNIIKTFAKFLYLAFKRREILHQIDWKCKHPFVCRHQLQSLDCSYNYVCYNYSVLSSQQFDMMYYCEHGLWLMQFVLLC